MNAQQVSDTLERLASLLEADVVNEPPAREQAAAAHAARFTVDEPLAKTGKFPALEFSVDPKEVAALNAKADAMQERLNAFVALVDSNDFKRKLVRAGNEFADAIPKISTALRSRGGAPLKDTKSRVDASFKSFHEAFGRLETAFNALRKSQAETSEKLHEIGWV